MEKKMRGLKTGGAKTKTVFLFACMLTAFQGNAQDSLHMSLDKAIEIALDKSPTIRIADREITKTEYVRKEQLAGLFPQVEASADYNRVIKKQVMAMNMGGTSTNIAVGTANSWSGGINLALPVVAPTLWKTIKMSETDVMLAVESARSSRISLIGEVKNAYYALLLAKDSYDVLLASYHNAELNAKNITDKFNQGLVSEYDKLRADVQVKNQKPGLTSAENGVRLADMQLKVLMGVDVTERIAFEGTLNEFESQMEAVPVDLLDDSTFQNSSDLKQLDIQKKKLEQNALIIRNGYMPTLNLTGMYQWNSLNENFRLGQYRWNPYSTVGLSLSVPIFDGLAKKQKKNQNTINIENNIIQRENTLRNLRLSASNNVNNMESAVAEVNSNRESIRQAEKAYSISQKQFEVGSATLLELNDAELALTQARLAYNQSIYNYLTAKSELEKTMGVNYITEDNETSMNIK